MARRKSSTANTLQRRRDLTKIARAVFNPAFAARLTRSRLSATPGADRRKWNPDRRLLTGIRRIPTIQAPPVVKAFSKVASPPRYRALLPSHRLRVANPRNAVHCHRRQVRKEVIHATRKAGSGVSRRPPRYRPESEISCR